MPRFWPGDMGDIVYGLLATMQPCSVNAAALQNMSKTIFYDFAAIANSFSADARRQAIAVSMNCGASLLVAMPA